MSFLHVASLLTLVSSTFSSLVALNFYVNPPLDVHVKKIEDAITSTERLCETLTVPIRQKIMRRSPDFFTKLSETLEVMRGTMNFLQERSLDATFAEKYLWSALKTRAKQAEATVNTMYKNLLRTTNSARLLSERTGTFMGAGPRPLIEWQRLTEEFNDSVHRDFMFNDASRALKLTSILFRDPGSVAVKSPLTNEDLPKHSRGDVDDDPQGSVWLR